MLRPVTRDDTSLLLELNSDPEVMRYITGRPSTAEEVATEVNQAIGSRWLAFRRDTGEFVGWFGAVPDPTGTEYEIGWRLRQSAWGHGFASEGARALIEGLFTRREVEGCTRRQWP